MKNRYILAALLLGGLLMGACEKDNGLPKGAIRLTAEGHQSHDKTSVSGTTVQWTGGETIRINGNDMVVHVSSSGQQAYIDASSLNLTGTAVYGYYNCGTISNEQTTSPTVIIPTSYESSYSDGRQVIQMPMAAYASSAGNAIAFKNLTAAVKVRVKNTTGHTIYLDKVVVSSTGQKLCGSVTLNLEASDFNLSSQSTSNNAEKSVTVSFPNEPVTIATGGEDIKEVQVPILPVSSTGDLTIKVYTHALASDIYPGAAKAHIDHTFTYTATTSPVLARNEIVTAQVKIGGDHTTTVDHSLFTVASGTQVRFSRGNLQATGTTASTPDGGWTWTFATKQWDYIGNATANTDINGNGTVSVNGTVDLFKWSTSNTYYGIHNNQDSTTAYSGDFRNWGELIEGNWYTLSKSEWEYLIGSNAGRPSAQYVKATVNGVHGLILFPDSWTNTSESDYYIDNFYINKRGIPFTDVNITSSDWTNKLEPNGAVFLPAAGVYRTAENGGSDVLDRVGDHCYYWSSTLFSPTFNPNGRAYNFLSCAGSGPTVTVDNCLRRRGMSVRLVLPGN